MKKVISENLPQKIKEAITLLCGTVKTTLGPKGQNVIIDHSDFSPFITNDGVTIASNIESDDSLINTILELAKEASITTNDNVGDGTTTTLVLLEALYNAGAELIAKGYSPIILKEQINKELNTIIEAIKKESRPVSNADLKLLATVSSGDTQIGQILADACLEVGPNNIYLKESSEEITNVTHTTGYLIDTILASPYFLNSSPSLIFDNPYILITNNIINTSEELSSILNFLATENKALIILAKDYDDYFLNEMLERYLSHENNIILLKNPGYGLEELNILKDLEVISNTKITNDFTPHNLGTVSKIIINNENTIFHFSLSSKITTYLKSSKVSPNSPRYGMLTKGFITINIGAPTTTELREKKMRYEDAICALKNTEEGLLPGSGLVLYKLSMTLDDKNAATGILKEALKAPLNQILINGGLDYQTIMTKIAHSGFKILYNVKEDSYENIKNTSILDSTKIVIASLKNAVSIACLLLTTSSLIINEQPKTLTKEDLNSL